MHPTNKPTNKLTAEQQSILEDFELLDLKVDTNGVHSESDRETYTKELEDLLAKLANQEQKRADLSPEEQDFAAKVEGLKTKIRTAITKPPTHTTETVIIKPPTLSQDLRKKIDNLNIALTKVVCTPSAASSPDMLREPLISENSYSKIRDKLIADIKDKVSECKTDAEFQSWFDKYLNGAEIKEPTTPAQQEIIGLLRSDEEQATSYLQRQKALALADKNINRYKFFDKLIKESASCSTYAQFQENLRRRLSREHAVLLACPKNVIAEIFHPYDYKKTAISAWHKYLGFPLAWSAIMVAFLVAMPLLTLNKLRIALFETPWSKATLWTGFVKILGIFATIIVGIIACSVLIYFAALNLVKIFIPFILAPQPFILAIPLIILTQLVNLVINIKKGEWKQAVIGFAKMLTAPIMGCLFAVAALINWFVPIPNFLKFAKSCLISFIPQLKTLFNDDNIKAVIKNNVDSIVSKYVNAELFKGEILLSTQILFAAKNSVGDKISLDAAGVDSCDFTNNPGEPDVEASIAKGKKSVIYFCGNGYSYQHAREDLQEYAERCDCHIRAFNYPSLHPDIKHDYNNNAVTLAVNAGIAQVYDVVQKRKLSFLAPMDLAKIEAQCALDGHSLGAGIALQVAAFFKIKYGADLEVYANRPFSSFDAAMAAQIDYNIAIPFWYGRACSRLLLYAAGDLNIDNVQAYRHLRPERAHYFNAYAAADAKSLDRPLSDPVIQDDATLTAELQQQSCGPLQGAKTLQRLNDDKSANILVAKDLEGGSIHGTLFVAAGDQLSFHPAFFSARPAIAASQAATTPAIHAMRLMLNS